MDELLYQLYVAVVRLWQIADEHGVLPEDENRLAQDAMAAYDAWLAEDEEEEIDG